MQQYLVPISDEKINETPIYRHPLAKDGFLYLKDPRKTNMQQQFLIEFEKHYDNKTLGTYNEEINQYDHLTYREILQTATALGSSLIKQNSIQNVQDDQNNIIKPVGIYLSNRREWTLIDIACILYGFTSCPFYDTLGIESLTYTMNTTQVSVCFVQQSTIKFVAQSNLPHLKTIVTVNVEDKESISILESQNKEVVTWEDYLKRGQNDIQPYPQLSPETPLTLVFTSGTTGQPKAAIQTHKNLSSMLTLFEYQEGFQFLETDVYLSYLPLPHIFERAALMAAMSGGAEINYFSGNIQNLLRDIQRCRPTYFCGVPKIYNRFYDSIQTQLSQLPPEMKAKFDEAVLKKIEYQKATGKATHEKLDEAFAKIKAIFGGRQRIMFTGAAPISNNILEFLRATLCCSICSLYGQTETTASLVTNINDFSIENVGGPTVCQEFKLISVPEMNYYTNEIVNGEKKIRGEVCLRGPSTFKGYFNNAQFTKETIDEDGWIHSGDIGQIVNGTLQLIDRKKSLFKLQQGEYVSPERVESCYLKVKGVNEIIVFGDSLQNSCVGVAVIEPTILQQYAKQLNLNGEYAELLQNQEIKKYILNLIMDQGKKDGLYGYEQIKNLYLESKPFSLLGLLTETLKMQRHKAKIYYENIIKLLYAEINSQ